MADAAAVDSANFFYVNLFNVAMETDSFEHVYLLIHFPSGEWFRVQAFNSDGFTRAPCMDLIEIKEHLGDLLMFLQLSEADSVDSWATRYAQLLGYTGDDMRRFFKESRSAGVFVLRGTATSLCSRFEIADK